MIFKEWIQWISQIGLTGKESYEDSKRIEFLNKICGCYPVISFVYIFVVLYLKSYFLVAVLMANMLIYLSCLKLNQLRHFNWTSCIVILNASITLYITSAVVGKDVNGQLLLVFVVPLAVMLFKKEQKLLRNTCLLFPLLSYIALELSDYYFFFHVHFPVSIIKALSISVFIVTCYTLYLMLEFYITIFQHVKHTLNQMLAIYPLTEREVEILTILIQGKNNKEIGKELFIQEATVKNHLNSIYKKFSVKSRSELMAACLSMSVAKA